MNISSILAMLMNYDTIDKSLLSRLARAAASGDRDVMLLITQEILTTAGPNPPRSVVDILNELIETVKSEK